MSNVLFTKYNRERRPEFSTKTSILETEDGTKIVRKDALTEKASAHLTHLVDMTKKLEGTLLNVKPLPVKAVDGGVECEYIKGTRIGEVLEAKLSDTKEFLKAVKEATECYLVFNEDRMIDFAMTPEFEKVFGECQYTGKAIAPADIDLIFDNFVVREDTCYVIDCEWTFDFGVPVQYIIFRSLYYLYMKNALLLQDAISIEKFMENFGIGKMAYDEFVKMEEQFQMYVQGEDRRFIYTTHYQKPVINLGEFINKYGDVNYEMARRDLDIKNLTDSIEDAKVRLYDMDSEVKKLNTQMAEFERASGEREANDARIIADLQRKLDRTLKYRIVRKLPQPCVSGLVLLKKEGPKAVLKKMKNYRSRSNQYDKWISMHEKNIMEVEPLAYEPKISVIIPVYNVSAPLLTDCINSVKNQTYQNWELCMADDCSTMPEVFEVLKNVGDDERIKIKYREENGHISRATNTALELATGEFVVLVDCDDMISPNALYEMAKMLNQYPELDFIYSDEDKMSEDGKERKNPFFKPDWSPDTLMSIMYTCHLSLYRKTLMDEVGGMRVGYEGSQDYDLALRIVEKTDKIGHIAKILYHWRERAESTSVSISAKPYTVEAGKRAKEDLLKRRNINGYMEYIETSMQNCIVYRPEENALVSIIIPSKDNYEFIERCITSISVHTKDVAYEIIVVDNGSSTANQAKYKELLDTHHATYIYEPKKFNFAGMCNRGAAEAKGNYLLFLNDDIEVTEDSWLYRLTGHAGQAHTGAVSCTLLYPNTNEIQHCGVLNLKNVGPVHSLAHMPDNVIWYYCRNTVEYNYVAVTGACLMVKRSKFDETGGFDEKLPVAYNDIDLCFSLVEKGYFNVVRTDVKLVHHESVSRGVDRLDEVKMKRLLEERGYLYEKHPVFNGYDPCYNRNLAQDKIDYQINMEY